MELYLIRHGEAEGPEKPDLERALTANGRQAVEQVAAHISSHGPIPSILYASPLKRAQETAAIFAAGWKCNVETVDWLQPSTPPSSVLKHLDTLTHTSALVGHLPNLGLVLSGLVWGMPPREISIPKAGVALLAAENWAPGTAKMHWLLSPDSL